MRRAIGQPRLVTAIQHPFAKPRRCVGLCLFGGQEGGRVFWQIDKCGRQNRNDPDNRRRLGLLLSYPDHAFGRIPLPHTDSIRATLARAEHQRQIWLCPMRVMREKLRDLRLGPCEAASRTEPNQFFASARSDCQAYQRHRSSSCRVAWPKNRKAKTTGRTYRLHFFRHLVCIAKGLGLIRRCFRPPRGKPSFPVARPGLGYLAVFMIPMKA